MSTLPALNAISSASNQGIAAQAFEDFLAAVKQIPGGGIAETTLTLASDAVTPFGGVGGIFTIDTEAAAASDNLATITQTNFPDGSCLIVRPASSARLVVVKHAAGGSGQILLRTAGDFTLGDTTHWLCLKRTGTSWQELWRLPALVWVGLETKTGSFTMTAADRAKIFDATSGSWTANMLPVATAGIGFHVAIRNSGTGVITLDGNASETIDGTTTLKLNPGHEIILVCDGTGWKSVSRHAPLVPQGHGFGCTLTNGTDATNDIDVAAGNWASDDATDAARVLLNAGAMTKQLDAVWAAGSAAGGRISSESLVNGTWHVYLFRRSSGVDDYCFSQSLTPTLPDSGTHKRRIGSVLRESAAIVGFIQDGDRFERKTPVLDVDASNPGTSAVTRLLSVPTGIAVQAHLNVLALKNANDFLVYLSALDVTDLAPSGTAAPLAGAFGFANNGSAGGPITVRTNTSGQIRSRLSLSGTGDTLRIATLGWSDRRGRDN